MRWQPFQKVIKVGDSLAVILPQPLTRGLGIQRGDIVSISPAAANIIQVRLYTSVEIDGILKNNPTLEHDSIT